MKSWSMRWCLAPRCTFIMTMIMAGGKIRKSSRWPATKATTSGPVTILGPPDPGNYGASIIAPENWEGSMGYKYEDTIFDPQLDRFVTKDEFLSFAENEPGRTAIVFSPPREQWLNDWITIAGYGISGDGMAGLDIEGNLMSWDAPYEDYAGHPRSAGSHALVSETGPRSECAAYAHTHSAKLHPCEAIR